MMRNTAYILIVAVLALGAPICVFAQGPFNDVPTDHWAYDAVNKLQKDWDRHRISRWYIWWEASDEPLRVCYGHRQNPAPDRRS